jgi:hypothetical protein
MLLIGCAVLKTEMCVLLWDVGVVPSGCVTQACDELTHTPRQPPSDPCSPGHPSDPKVHQGQAPTLGHRHPNVCQGEAPTLGHQSHPTKTVHQCEAPTLGHQSHPNTVRQGIKAPTIGPPSDFTKTIIEGEAPSVSVHHEQ